MDAVTSFINRIKALLASRRGDAEASADGPTAGSEAADVTSGERWQDRAKTYAESAKVKAAPQVEKAKTYADSALVKAGPQIEKAKEKAAPQVAKARERLAAR